MVLCFIALGEINAQSEDYAKYYNKANSLSESDFEKAEKFCAEIFQVYEMCRKNLINGYTKRVKGVIDKAVYWLEELFFSVNQKIDKQNG